MQLLDLFSVASMPVLEVLLVTALGSFLALDRINIMGGNTRKELNQVVFFVLNPALVASSLAKTITYESFVYLWFMPINILFIFVIGSALGWILVKLTGAPKHLNGLILGCCAAGNMGNVLFIIIPAVCREKGSPFGSPDVCYTYGIAYSSLSLAIGAIYLWSYVYNLVSISSSEGNKKVDSDDTTGNVKAARETSKLVKGNCSEAVVYLEERGISDEQELLLPLTKSDRVVKIHFLEKVKHCFRMISMKINLKAIFAPSTTAAVIGFIIGVLPPIRKSLIGASAPLHVLEDSASLIGDAAIPIVSLILGGNLLGGLTGSGIRPSIIVGILVVRYVFLPLLGIVIVKGAVHFGLVQADPLYQFILLLQFAVPPALNIGTITQLFGAGESECSVIMLWTYGLASISLSLWSTFFLWLLA